MKCTETNFKEAFIFQFHNPRDRDVFSGRPYGLDPRHFVYSDGKVFLVEPTEPVKSHALCSYPRFDPTEFIAEKFEDPIVLKTKDNSLTDLAQAIRITAQASGFKDEALDSVLRAYDTFPEGTIFNCEYVDIPDNRIRHSDIPINPTYWHDLLIATDLGGDTVEDLLRLHGKAEYVANIWIKVEDTCEEEAFETVSDVLPGYELKYTSLHTWAHDSLFLWKTVPLAGLDFNEHLAQTTEEITAAWHKLDEKQILNPKHRYRIQSA